MSWLIRDEDQDEKQIAKYLSMSVETLPKVCGHLHPDAEVGEAFSFGQGGTQEAAEPAKALVWRAEKTEEIAAERSPSERERRSKVQMGGDANASNPSNARAGDGGR